MCFQNKLIWVFLFVLIYFQMSESSDPPGLNKTLFVFNNPKNCKSNEFYSFSNFTCSPCNSKLNLTPSHDKLSCGCRINYTATIIYDSFLRGPNCVENCQNTKNKKCFDQSLIQSTCNLKIINITEDQMSTSNIVRIKAHTLYSKNECKCEQRYNYLFGEYCIGQNVLKKIASYNSFLGHDRIYSDLKYIAFFCQYFENVTACNHLANLCVYSFFNVEKNSPCSLFMLAQASDATLYSSMGEGLRNLKPFLFYKKGKETVEEIDKKIEISFVSNERSSHDPLGLFLTIHELNGKLIKWEKFRISHVNLCGKSLQRNFQNFKSFRIACDLTLESVIELASAFGNKEFFTIFLNHTNENDVRLFQTIPILIENVFDGNKGSNVGDWQLVKRFQILAAETTVYSTSATQANVFEDIYKLKMFKSIRILRKFELRYTITKQQQITLPLIILDYHKIDFSSNTSIDEVFKFELIVKFQKESSSNIFYKCLLYILLTVGLVFSIFKTNILKNRKNLEFFDIELFFHFVLHITSNIGNSFLATVIIDIFNSILTHFAQPFYMHMLPDERINVYQIFIYSALLSKIIYFIAHHWQIAHVDIFLVDWERPKNCDAPFFLKNNLDTSSQSSSIRTLTENNVSAWRTFFLANEWIDLSCKQITSSFGQAFVSLAIYWVINYLYPFLYSEPTIQIFTSIAIYSFVYFIQRLIRAIFFDRLLGCPLEKFLDICTLANISIFTLLDCSFGFYLHGRSPHGVSDTDMSSMILQLQRESQHMCGKRGLLMDSDFQTYAILPPLSLRKQIDKLLPSKQGLESLSQINFQKDCGLNGPSFENMLGKNSSAYNRINRFLCAFIDHGIKDMDYIIKEKSFLENLLGIEIESFVTENKGTFYIDASFSFSSLFLYGNANHIFIMELLLLIAIILISQSFIISIVIVCVFNKLFQKIFRNWVKNNVGVKTLISKRFLM